MIRTIDSLSYRNHFRSVSPMWKSGFAALLFVLAYFAHEGVQVMVFAWMVVWTVGYAGIPLRAYLLLFGVSCLFFAMSIPALVLEVGASSLVLAEDGWILGTLGRWTVYLSQAGLSQSLEAFARIAACLACLFFVIFTTPVAEMLQVMKRLRMPHLVLEIMLIMYRFLFLLADTAQDMVTAQRARGGYTGYRQSLRDTAILVVRLFEKSMQRYKGLSQGLIARGFTDEIAFAPYRAQPVARRYLVESALGVMVLLAVELVVRWGMV